MGVSATIAAYPPEALNAIINYLNNDAPNDNPKEAVKKAFEDIISTYGTAHEQDVLDDLRKVTVHKQNVLDEFLNEQDAQNLIQSLYRNPSSIADEPIRMGRMRSLIHNYQLPPFKNDYQAALKTALSDVHVHEDSTFPILWELWKTESPEHKIAIGLAGMYARSQRAIKYSEEQYDKLAPAAKQNLFERIYLTDRLKAMNLEPGEVRRLIQLTAQDEGLNYADAAGKVITDIPSYNKLKLPELFPKI